MIFERIRILYSALCCSVFIASLSCSSVPEKNRADINIQQNEVSERKQHEAIAVKPLLKIIRRHKQFDTHMDGPRCYYYPTCSHWALSALTDYPLTGFLLVVDRLFYREWRGKKFYLPVPARKSSDLRYYDPVSDALPLTEKHRSSLLLEDFDPR